MPFVFQCIHCGKPVSAGEDHRGLKMACPHCAGHFTVPAATSTQSAGAARAFARDALSASNLHVASLRFSFTCTRCGSMLEARGEMCGQSGRCPTCGAVFVVPQVDPRTGTAMSRPKIADDGQLPTPMHAYATAGDRAPKMVRRPDGTQAIQCPRCLRHMPVDANICAACGIPFTMEGASTVVQTSQPLDSRSGWALTFGIFAVLSFCFPVLAFVAIGLGWYALSPVHGPASRGGRAMAWTGLILGAISLLLFAILCYAKFF